MLWLLVDAGMLCLGLGAGALAMFVAVLVSAGESSAADERNRLIELLKSHKISDETIIKILREGGDTLWARLRFKTRPILWRYGYDWPEFAPLQESDLQTYFAGLIPASPPSFAPLAMPESALVEDIEIGPGQLPDAFLPPNLSDIAEHESGPEEAQNQYD